MPTEVFVSGGTGYIGRRLIAELCERRHRVKALARAGSEKKLQAGCEIVTGDALAAGSFREAVPKSGTFVHLVGVAHPAPWKEREFRAIDLASLKESVDAAVSARVAHFVFVSVAHPAPAMKAYIRVRSECEEIIGQSGLTASILRPWYVLGPGHRWPVVLKPFYAMAERIPSWREGSLRLGLVTLRQMVQALAWAVDHPASESRILDVPAIRAIAADRFAASPMPVANS